MLMTMMSGMPLLMSFMVLLVVVPPMEVLLPRSVAVLALTMAAMSSSRHLQEHSLQSSAALGQLELCGLVPESTVSESNEGMASRTVVLLLTMEKSGLEKAGATGHARDVRKRGGVLLHKLDLLPESDPRLLALGLM